MNTLAVRTPALQSRLPSVGTTIFTVMSALAQEVGAVNLGQGFPDFDCDPALLKQVGDAMNDGLNQYPPMAGVPQLRQAVELVLMLGTREPTLAARGARALLEGPLAAYNYEGRRSEVAQQLAFLTAEPALCVAALGRNLELPRWQLRFLSARAECLERANHPLAGRARSDLTDWVGNSEGDISVGLELPPPVLQATSADEYREDGVMASPLDVGALDAPRVADAGAEHGGGSDR